mgnify:CR=1 FL=1
MREEVRMIRGNIYLATYEHKHGMDKSIHKTLSGAQEWAKSIAADWIDMFLSDDDMWRNLSIDEVVENWGEITGHTEFFNIEEYPLND